VFLGEYSHTLDSKNRLTLPSRLREEMGDRAVLVKSIDNCVSVYNTEAWAAYTAKLDALPGTEARVLKRFIYSSAFEAELDSQGRILIPANLCQYAGLEKNIKVIGAGDHVELWSESLWDENQQTIDTAAMEALMIKLGF
jgi:MraZ protein